MIDLVRITVVAAVRHNGGRNKLEQTEIKHKVNARPYWKGESKWETDADTLDPRWRP